MGRLDGKVAIVTGAARGTGETTARLFANEGARVFLTDVLDAAGEAVAKEIGGEAAYQRLDVSSESDWQTVVDRAVERFGRLDVLINNAGILHMAAITDTALEDYERVVRVNQIGTFLGLLFAPFEQAVFRQVRPELPAGHWPWLRAMAFLVAWILGTAWAARRRWNLGLATLLALPAAFSLLLLSYESAGAFPISDRYLYLQLTPRLAFLSASFAFRSLWSSLRTVSPKDIPRRGRTRHSGVAAPCIPGGRV